MINQTSLSCRKMLYWVISLMLSPIFCIRKIIGCSFQWTMRVNPDPKKQAQEIQEV